jgi:hypothetical protein
MVFLISEGGIEKKARLKRWRRISARATGGVCEKKSPKMWPNHIFADTIQEVFMQKST